MVFPGSGDEAEHVAHPTLRLVSRLAFPQVKLSLAGGEFYENRTSVIGNIDWSQQVDTAVSELLRGQDTVAGGGQAVDYGANAGTVDVRKFLGGEVDPLHQGAAVDPLRPFVPAFHRGRLQKPWPM